jgi:multiple sugar transport system permease protein
MVAVPQKETRLVGKIVGASSDLKIRQALWAYVFLLPWVIGLVVFWAGPILASFYFSFSRYDVITPPRFIGLQNYERAFANDPLVWPSLGRTLKYSVAVVPVGIVGSLILAMLLNRGVSGTNTYRTLFYLPSLTPAVATALLWQWMFQPTIGPINMALGALGIEGPGWLASESWAMIGLIIMNTWRSLGSNRMLIFLAALQGVPQQLLEAAEIDGAGTWSKFRNVTIPMISPTIFFNLIMGVIGALKVFTSAFVATEGGPSYATWFYALHIYNQAFKYFQMGYGSALAWIFVLILFLFTYFQMRLSRRWVYYAGE